MVSEQAINWAHFLTSLGSTTKLILIRNVFDKIRYLPVKPLATVNFWEWITLGYFKYYIMKEIF